VIRLDAKQKDALRAIIKLWPEDQVVLVGAAAVSCFLELRRMTADIDPSVSLPIDNYEQELRRLGWSRHAKHECRWFAPGKVTVDIMPAAPQLLAVGYVVWPASGMKMSLTGVRLAMSNSVLVEIEPGLVLRVAPLHVLVVLKMAAYVDRPAGREKDLGDIAVIVEGYVDEERRFSDEVIDPGLPYPDVSPHLLGADLARLVNSEEREAIRNFLAMAHDENDSHPTLARMAQAAPQEYRDPAQLLARLDAFERGLGV